MSKGGERVRCTSRVSVGGGSLLTSIWVPSFQQQQGPGFLVPVGSVSGTSCLEVADLNSWWSPELSLWDSLVLSSGLKMQQSSQVANHEMIPVF